MCNGIDNRFPDCSYRKFIGIRPDNPVNLRTSVNMPKDKLIGFINLLINRAFKFFTVDEHIPVCPFKQCALNFRISYLIICH